MINHLAGKLIEKKPSYVILECNGVGYHVNISLHTYGKLPSEEQCKLLIHFLVREDEHKLFGFFTENEREIFRLLIGVSGVGATTAQIMLSSMRPDEVSRAIAEEDVNLLKSIKGIGAKTAQRVIVDLKDKIDKITPDTEFSDTPHNTGKDEALSALAALGIDKIRGEKAVGKVLKNNPEYSVGEIVKHALKSL